SPSTEFAKRRMLALALLPKLVFGQSCAADSQACQEWRSFERCAIPAGDDLGEPLWLTVQEAKLRCEEEAECAGFTFEGSRPEGPLSGGRVWVHLKRIFDCVDAEWVAWRKAAGHQTAQAPAPAPPEALSAAASGAGTALCLQGQVRMLAHTHLALEQHLLQVLQPDLFLYGPKTPEDTPEGPEIYSLKDYVVEARWEVENIRDQLYNETSNPGQVIDLEYLQVQGNWFGSQCLDPPLRDNRPGSAICSYYSQQKCLEMIQAQEAQRGQAYHYVVVSRFDFRWLAPHPPVELLAGDAVWIPSGSDWEGGINDRHAAMPRHLAETYLGAWRLLTSGQAKEAMVSTLGPTKVNGYPGPNTENFLLARLHYFGVEYERFPSVAYLTCTLRSKSRWTQCFGTTSHDAPGWLYKEEMEHATRIAKCVRFAWTPRKMEDCKEDISHLYRGFR
ncbi:unnamed protein product, partial [Effrenium voratum]